MCGSEIAGLARGARRRSPRSDVPRMPTEMGRVQALPCRMETKPTKKGILICRGHTGRVQSRRDDFRETGIDRGWAAERGGRADVQGADDMAESRPFGQGRNLGRGYSEKDVEVSWVGSHWSG
ncbi:hypothetical protein CPLU01_05518 [Colletotrichum plurivorum]|uniref:Uncharacterized protein n=1 Tax=Colletotrichum plurivorum TaxID=2175906 RepID=A0A8H6NI59_9PEZI|nr:hypothetical protein CPLU01_05518 [Colletotrichum plurivorum]